MPDGAAEGMREETRHNLICIVDGCDSPRLKAVSRSKARDGFSHIAGGGHSGTTIHRLQSQLLIERWLHHRYGDHLTSQRNTTAAQRKKQGDVTVTSVSSGKQVALTIQYAALTPDQWGARQAAYTAGALEGVWIFGHVGAQLRPASRHRNGIIQLTELQEHVLTRGLIPLWLNPMTAHVAWATSITQPHLLARQGKGSLSIRPLDECTLRPDGIHHPDLDRVYEVSLEQWEKDRAHEKQLAMAAEREAAERQARRLRRKQAVGQHFRDIEIRRQGPQRETGLTCAVCGQPLAEVLETLGRHMLCEEEATSPPQN